MSEPRNPLENTQTGDLLYISNGRTFTISRATHVTKTQVHAASRKFSRDGSEIGADIWSRHYARPASEEDISIWSRHYARPASEEDIREDRRRALARNLYQVEYIDLSLDQLERIWGIVEEGTNE
jgi:hypothetical protein